MPANRACRLVFFLAVVHCLPASAADNAKLLFFFSGDFKPCLQMYVVADQLAAAGYEVEKIDVGKSDDQVDRLGVESIPCFVIVDGAGVKKVPGVTSKDALLKLLRPASKNVHSQVPLPAAKPPLSKPQVAVNTATIAPDALRSRVLQATVRIGVVRGNATEYGSGTVVQSDDNGSLVTCGHIFKKPKRDRVRVTVFSGAKRHTYDGEVLSYDLVEDVGLVAVKESLDVQPIPMSPTLVFPEKGEKLFVSGCDGGGGPAVRPTSVKLIYQVKTTPNIRIDTVPEHGRSGGGLITPTGTLVGVCSGRNLEESLGIYASLRGIYPQIEKMGAVNFTSARNSRPNEVAASPSSSRDHQRPAALTLHSSASD